MKKFFRKIVIGAIWVYYKIVHRYSVEGQENIPREGAVIFCGNHRSNLDPPLMKITAKRETHFLAKESLFKKPFLGALGKLFGEIPVTKDAKDLNAIKTSLKYLKNGECIALFPEGTRNGLAKGKKVKDGAAFFAVRTKATVIPVGITGTMKPFCKLKIKYGKPLDFSNYNKNDAEALDEVTDIIMKKILELVEY